MNLVNKLDELGLVKVIQTLGVVLFCDLCNFFNFELNLELEKPFGILKSPQEPILVHRERITLRHSLEYLYMLIH